MTFHAPRPARVGDVAEDFAKGVRMRAVAIGCLALGLCSCREPALEFAPPDQRAPLEKYKAPAARVINMDDPDAPRSFVRDILSFTAANWRWTEQRPAVRVRVRDSGELKYVIDFAVPEITLRDTGPVTIAFTVNDHVLDRVRYATAGQRHFEKTVPPGWVEVNKDAIAGAEIDKIWVSKEDGQRFGFILVRIGLTR